MLSSMALPHTEKRCLQTGVAVKEKEAATDAELLEACYAVLRAEHRGKPRPGIYYRSIFAQGHRMHFGKGLLSQATCCHEL